MESIKGIIYLYQNTINTKYYVGCTTEHSSQERFAAHSRGSSGCRVFNRAVKKYGIDNFIQMIVEDNIPTVDQLHVMERFWIKELESFKGNGYNLTSGGEVGKEFNHTQEARSMISINNARYWAGVPVSEERKANIRAALVGRKIHEDIKKKQAESMKMAYVAGRKLKENSVQVICNNTGVVYASIGDASYSVGGSRTGLSTAFNRHGSTATYKGHEFTRQDSNKVKGVIKKISENSDRTVPTSKWVRVINVDSGLVFSSITEARNSVGVYSGMGLHCVLRRGNGKCTYHGIRFEVVPYSGSNILSERV